MAKQLPLVYLIKDRQSIKTLAMQLAYQTNYVEIEVELARKLFDENGFLYITTDSISHKAYYHTQLPKNFDPVVVG